MVLSKSKVVKCLLTWCLEVDDLHWEFKGSCFNSSYAEVSPLQLLSSCVSVMQVEVVERSYRDNLPFLLPSIESLMFVRENPK